MAGFAVGGLVSHLFHSGAELAQVDSEGTAGLRFMQKTGQQALLSLVRPYAAQSPPASPGGSAGWGQPTRDTARGGGGALRRC